MGQVAKLINGWEYLKKKSMNTLTLTLSGMQNNMNGEINKKLGQIMRIMEWQMAKIQLLEREVIALKLASTTELDIDEGDEMELDIGEGEEVKVKVRRRGR